MTASRASRSAAGLVLAGLLLGVVPAAGAAELAQAQGAPIQLIPIRPRYEEPRPAAPPGQTATPSLPAPGFGATAPSQAAPTPPFAPVVLSAPEGAASSAPKGIEVDKLGSLDVDALGVLDPSQGGLGLDLWRGTPRAVVERLLGALPAGIPSPALRELAHRLLLSSAAPPSGPRGGGPSLIALRAAKLAEMGDIAGMRALTAAIPGRADDEALARLGVESGLIDGNTQAVCADVGSLIREYHRPFWQKVQVYCQALAKKSQLVDVGVTMLHEEADDRDPAYFTLIDTLMGGKSAKIATLADATPLLLDMMRSAKQALPDDVLRASRPLVLRAVAASPNASRDLRLAAAERATLLGSLSNEALRQVYDGVQLDETELASALSKAQVEYGPRARVLLYRAAGAQKVPAARAEALRAALSLARSAGVYDLALAVNLPFIESVAPSPELGFFAVEAGRALFYTGQADKAEGWLALTRADNAAAALQDNAPLALWPYRQLDAPDKAPWDNERFLAWLAATKAQGGAEAKLAGGRAARLLGLASALGGAVTEAAWQGLYAETEAEPAAMPSLAVWQGLKAAAAAGRRGETALLALTALGAGGAQDANPIALDATLAALKAVGLDKEARRLAIEAAVAAGI